AARLLTDPASQDWQDHRAADEGGRCSHAVQWWWLHLQALCRDAKRHLSAALADELLVELLTLSLGQITVHYGQVTLASEERTAQLRVDLVAVLLCVSELVLAVATAPEQLFAAEEDGSPAALVAAQCRALLLLLGHLAAPLKIVLWNQRRPLWLQALVDLVRPLLATAVAALVEDVQEGTPQGAEPLAVPAAAPPLGLGVHVLLSGLYDLLNDQEVVMGLAAPGQERRVADALVAVGETLCRLGPGLQHETTALAEVLGLLAGSPPPLPAAVPR
ncbi:uncharacterized protein KIAA0825 homolog, partial [Pollicipes pollicipes]|uniref:uncharacterized protein KIAA0825 homolog n=1 Tax=Pollicipes pollicipes TaxID=41117 RepID=UPI0018856885